MEFYYGVAIMKNIGMKLTFQTSSTDDSSKKINGSPSRSLTLFLTKGNSFGSIDPPAFSYWR